MASSEQHLGLTLANELAAQGRTGFTFAEAQACVNLSPTATANLLKRMVTDGLVDKVRRGHYVLRPLGVLGTPSVAEDVALAVRAAFGDTPHRLAYRTALYEHDLITHPLRSIQVATTKRTRSETLSGWPLRAVVEPEAELRVGSMRWNGTSMSDLERALLDAAHRPSLVGGVEVLVEAVAAASSRVDVDTLTQYARQLKRSAALRRIGSIADALDIDGLAHQLKPLSIPTSDIDLEPGTDQKTVWRDARWRLRWSHTVDELQAIAEQ